ncbi:MAG: response regulator [Desulfobaccales bacterium]
MLLVEDGLGEAPWIKELVEAAERSFLKLELQHFSHPSEALEYLAVKTSHAILLDLGLPDNQGMKP